MAAAYFVQLDKIPNPCSCYCHSWALLFIISPPKNERESGPAKIMKSMLFSADIQASLAFVYLRIGAVWNNMLIFSLRCKEFGSLSNTLGIETR